MLRTCCREHKQACRNRHGHQPGIAACTAYAIREHVKSHRGAQSYSPDADWCLQCSCRTLQIIHVDPGNPEHILKPFAWHCPRKFKLQTVIVWDHVRVFLRLICLAEGKLSPLALSAWSKLWPTRLRRVRRCEIGMMGMVPSVHKMNQDAAWKNDAMILGYCGINTPTYSLVNPSFPVKVQLRSIKYI